MFIITKAEAKRRGYMYFFTGRPCANGHLALRYASYGRCVGCGKDVDRLIKEERAARRATRVPSPRQAAKDAGLLRYSTGKPCSRRGHMAERLVSNGSCLRCCSEKTARAYEDAEERARLKAYRKENAERYRCHTRNRRATARAVGSHTAEDIRDLFDKQHGKCIYCMTALTGWHVDHRTPLELGGSNGRENLQLLCPTCNLRKSWKDPLVFARENGFLVL